MSRPTLIIYRLTLAALCVLFAVAAVWVGWGWIFAALLCLMLLADGQLTL